MQPTTPFLTRMKLRGYRRMAGQLRLTSVWPPMTSRYYQTGQSLPPWPAIICPWWWCGGVNPIPCVSTHRISDPRSGPAQLLPPHVKQRSHPTGSVHKSQTVSVVGMSGQLKRCNESWFGSLQSGQFAAGWLAGSILCR